jgi:Flp pilus assembly protein TadD
MTQLPCNERSVLRRLTSPLTAVSMALLSGACTGPHEVPAQLDSPSVTSPETADSAHNAAHAIANAQTGATAYRVSHDDPRTLLAEARRLRRDGNKKGAYALLEQAADLHPGERTLMKERGLLAVELGHIAKGKDLLNKAMGAGAPDWRLHSALGAALAASGEQQEAQAQFAKALELAPEHPAVLNNLALSYALDGKHEEAERLLRRASEWGPSAIAKGQAKQNLALILGLSGRTDEARRLSEATLPAPQSRANMAYLQKIPETDKVSPTAEATRVRSAHATDAGPPAPTYRLGGPRE